VRESRQDIGRRYASELQRRLDRNQRLRLTTDSVTEWRCQQVSVCRERNPSSQPHFVHRIAALRPRSLWPRDAGVCRQSLVRSNPDLGEQTRDWHVRAQGRTRTVWAEHQARGEPECRSANHSPPERSLSFPAENSASRRKSSGVMASAPAGHEDQHSGGGKGGPDAMPEPGWRNNVGFVR